MYKLFDKESGVYTLPNGSIKTSQELQSDPQYSLLFSRDCVIELVDGIFTSYETLANFANRYGIDYETGSSVSADEALAMALEKKKEQDTLNNMVANPFSVLYSAVKISALSFTDEQAIQVADLYPEFELNHEYKKDERFTYNGRLFKVNQAHTSAAQWVPGEVGTESLYTNLMLNDAGYQIWKQPTGAHDAYNTGDVVEYKGVLYKSLIDGNAWAPDVYPAGWQEYDESTSTEPGTPEPGTPDPGTETYPDFVQPTGAHDAYKKGDIVRYNGKLYQSLIDANAYSPDAYPQGWQEYSEE